MIVLTKIQDDFQVIINECPIHLKEPREYSAFISTSPLCRNNAAIHHITAAVLQLGVVTPWGRLAISVGSFGNFSGVVLPFLVNLIRVQLKRLINRARFTKLANQVILSMQLLRDTAFAFALNSKSAPENHK